ncbi:hypothetical protein L798_07332 [Zootermopsis nevadensis]|uniref:Uncharacterized protein n=1 Tax=Zootermopsis nevadensis TaxID=136037 RepID=A0A067R675_ZOONE|nr:hypothetical protein L798_07332 [Zootermopsis nevadensis]
MSLKSLFAQNIQMCRFTVLIKVFALDIREKTRHHSAALSDAFEVDSIHACLCAVVFRWQHCRIIMGAVSVSGNEKVVILHLDNQSSLILRDFGKYITAKDGPGTPNDGTFLAVASVSTAQLVP